MQFKHRYEGNWVESERMTSMPTGLWRFQRPVIKTWKCCQCGWCYIFCPTGSMRQKGDHFMVDLENCKGCGVCASVCPNWAIAMVKEAAE